MSQPPTEERPAAESPGTSFELANATPYTVPVRGVVTKIPPDHDLLVNGHLTAVPASVDVGAVVQAVARNNVQTPAPAPARRPVPAPPPRMVYKDRTVRAPEPRTVPVPKDRTAAKGVLVRLGAPPAAPPAPPPSPLKVATLMDGAPMPETALGDQDLSDLTGDLGGGPSEADLAHAKREQP